MPGQIIPPSLAPLMLETAGLGASNGWTLCATRQNSMANDGTRGAGRRLVRVAHIATHTVTAICLKYTNTYQGGNGETPNSNPISVVGAIEYPTGSCYQVAFNGAQVGVIAGGYTILSDAIAITIPAGAVFWTRCIAQECAVPTAVAAVGAAVGALSAGTWFYKATAVSALGESGPSSEVSATVGASGSVNLTLTDNNILTPATGFKIYRGTSTGTEAYLATVAAGTTWVDLGQIPIGVGSPPSAQVVPFGIQLSQTYNSEGQIFSAASIAQLTASSPGFGSVNSNCFSECAIYGLGKSPIPAVAVTGDSIITGTGDSGYNGRTYGDSGFCIRALDAAQIPHISLSQGGETLANFQGTQRQNRLVRLIGCKHVISNYGTNSLAASSVAAMQAAILEISGAVINTGSKIWWCTINPKTTSTDNWTTAVNQTPLNTPDGVDPTYNTPELRRLAVNAWLRDGSASGFVAQVGGGNVCGTFDTASTVEVNSSNAIVLNGGRYICGTPQITANYGTIDGTHPSTVAHVLMQAGIATSSLS